MGKAARPRPGGSSSGGPAPPGGPSLRGGAGGADGVRPGERLRWGRGPLCAGGTARLLRLGASGRVRAAARGAWGVLGGRPEAWDPEGRGRRAAATAPPARPTREPPPGTPCAAAAASTWAVSQRLRSRIALALTKLELFQEEEGPLRRVCGLPLRGTPRRRPAFDLEGVRAGPPASLAAAAPAPTKTTCRDPGSLSGRLGVTSPERSAPDCRSLSPPSILPASFLPSTRPPFFPPTHPSIRRFLFPS